MLLCSTFSAIYGFRAKAAETGGRGLKSIAFLRGVQLNTDLSFLSAEITDFVEVHQHFHVYGDSLAESTELWSYMCTVDILLLFKTNWRIVFNINGMSGHRKTIWYIAMVV